MKKTLLFILLILFAVCLLACKDKNPAADATTDPVTTAVPTTTEAKTLPPFIRDGKKPAFILLGQSNMLGKDKSGNTDGLKSDLVKIYRKGKWDKFSEPIFPGYGTSLSATFSLDFAAEYGEVGLILCAVDGSVLGRDWIVGDANYKNTVSTVKHAVGNEYYVAGILWQQGEGDSANQGYSANYKQNFITLMSAFKKDLNLDDDLPILIGEIGTFVGRTYVSTVNRTFHELENEDPNIFVIKTSDLKDVGDNLHFDSASQRTMGHRYFEQYQKMLIEKYGVTDIDPSKYVK